MTKSAWALALLAVLWLPAAHAHGAPEAREIDERVLIDDDGAVGYGAGADQGVPTGSGHDLLALDIREALDPLTGAPSLVFRLIVQGGDPSQGPLRDTITLNANGGTAELGFTTTDGSTFEGIGFGRVAGPFPVGDGHPKAIDGWIALEALGVAPGDALEGIVVQGHVGEEQADVMPGGFSLGGVDVPTDGAAGAYTLAGPRTYARLEVAANDTVAPDATVTLTLTSTLEGLEQTVHLNATGPDGVTATLVSDVVALAPGESRTVALMLSAEPGASGGTLSIRAVAALGELAIGATQVLVAVEGAGDAGDGAEVLSGDLGPGDSYSYTFLAPGTFEYHCHPHPWMAGTITIGPAAGSSPRTHIIELVEPSEGDAQTWRFTPDALDIQAGDTVVWVNQGQMVHDVRGFNADAGGEHGQDHDHGDHDHGAPTDVDTPMPFLLPALLGGLLLRRWRR